MSASKDKALKEALDRIQELEARRDEARAARDAMMKYVDSRTDIIYYKDDIIKKLKKECRELEAKVESLTQERCGCA